MGYPVSLVNARMNVFEDHVNHRLSQWTEAGLFLHQLRSEWRRAALGIEIRNSRATSSFAPLELQSFYLVYIFLLIFLIIAVMIFAYEITPNDTKFKATIRSLFLCYDKDN